MALRDSLKDEGLLDRLTAIPAITERGTSSPNPLPSLNHFEEEVGWQTPQEEVRGSKGHTQQMHAETKALLVDLIAGQTDRIQGLDEVFECNKRDYLQIMVRLTPLRHTQGHGGDSSEPSERRKLVGSSDWLFNPKFE